MEEPFALNGLQNYHAGQTLIEAADLPEALTRLALSGQLPMAAFGTRLAAQLQTKAEVVLERKAAWMQHYPQALPAQSIELSVDGMTLTGTLEGLRRCEGAQPDAGWLLLSQRVGAVLEGQKEAQTARVHVVTSLWVHHLVACASGMPLTSVQLGLDGQVVFKPLTPAVALPLLQRLVQVYRAAWERPLPVGCKTAWAFLQAQAQADRLAISQPDKEPKDPHEAAQVAFDGGHHAGERSESAYLTRAFACYEDIEPELPDWAALLYGDMAQHIQRPAAQEHAHD
jgi:exodeoxyribonuclease V gamma subunit